MLETYHHQSLLNIVGDIATRFIRQPRATLKQMQLEQLAFAGDSVAAEELYRAIEIPTVIEFRTAASALIAARSKDNETEYDFEQPRQRFVMMERVGIKTGRGLRSRIIHESQRLVQVLADSGGQSSNRFTLGGADLYAAFLQSTSPDIRNTANTMFRSLGFMPAVTVFGSLTESQHRFLTTNNLDSNIKARVRSGGQFNPVEFADRVVALEAIFERELRRQYLKDIEILTGVLPQDHDIMDMYELSRLDSAAFSHVSPYDSQRVQLETELRQTLLEPRGYLRQTVGIALNLYGEFYQEDQSMLAPLAAVFPSGMFAQSWDEYIARNPFPSSV